LCCIELSVTRWLDKFEGSNTAPHGDTADLYAGLLGKADAAFLTSIPPPEQGTTRRELEVAAMKHFMVYDGKKFPDDISSDLVVAMQSQKKMSHGPAGEGSGTNPPDGAMPIVS
jgi:hypothetical protein